MFVIERSGLFLMVLEFEEYDDTIWVQYLLFGSVGANNCGDDGCGGICGTCSVGSIVCSGYFGEAGICVVCMVDCSGSFLK